MTSKTYDFKLTVANTAGFSYGNVIVGNTSATVATISNVDHISSTIKVKLANVLTEFYTSEYIHSNVAVISGTANGYLNTSNLPFQANIFVSNSTIASTAISSIVLSPYIAEKNAFTQNPVVRLYSIYYPGDWYPNNEYGNPTGVGAGRSWPSAFPIRFAEIIGDTADDLSYAVSYGGTDYMPFPVDLSGLQQGSDGKINELSLTVFNVDNIISYLVENPYLSGNNISNSVVALVNSEYLHGIDPRTVNADPSDLGSPGSLAYDTLTRARANGLVYDETITSYYGKANAAFDKTQTESVGGDWRSDKNDSRDLLGAVVEIKSTFVNFLDVWPEYSLITDVDSTTVSVNNALPYRPGDNVRSSKGEIEATIISIENNQDLYLSNMLNIGTSAGDPLYIVNLEADADSYSRDEFKIDQLEGLNEHVATFNLTSWMQYFKIVTPKRKYYKNTCQWKYKGEECQYPDNGVGSIPGSTLYANGMFTAAGVSTEDPLQDVCSKSFTSCKLRNNGVHYGGFPGTGRSVPRS